MSTKAPRVGASPIATDEKEADLKDEEEKSEVKLEELDPQTQFFYHCRRGDVDSIKAVSAQISDINAQDNKPSPHIGYCSKNTALHYAVESGSLEAVQVVFNEGAAVDRPNKLDSTPLHLAASLGYTEIVEFFLKMKANTSAQNKIGNTALHCAVYAGHTDTVRLLLDNVDDPQKALLVPRNGIGLGAVKYTAHDELKTYLKQFFPKNEHKTQEANDYHPQHIANGKDEEKDDEGSVNETTSLTGNATATEQQ